MQRRWLMILAIMLCMQTLHAQHYFNPRKIVTGSTSFLADYTQRPVQYSVIDSAAIDTLPHTQYYPWHLATLTEAFDTAGKLVFWSNGMTVSTLHSAYMKGGDTLSTSPMHNNNRYTGTPPIKGSLVLPCPGKPYWYYLIYPDYIGEGNWCPAQGGGCQLYFATIDMQADSGRGEVVSKENLLLDAPYAQSGINAVRHGNGRDWWIVQPDYGQYDTGGYYVALLDSAGIHPFEHQRAIGAPKGRGYANGMHTAFSSDGEWLACGGVFKEGYTRDSPNSAKYIGFELLRFDRCTGKLSDCHTVIPPWMYPVLWNTPDLVFSASGRYLYVTSGVDLYQYDIQAEDISQSGVYICSSAYFGFGSALMPDSTIFMCTNNYPFITIRNPDIGGLGCHVEVDTLADLINLYGPAYKVIRLIGDSVSYMTMPWSLNPIEAQHLSSVVPHYPNYMLSSKECNARIDAPENDKYTLFYPNPANGSITIDNSTPLSADLMVSIFNTSGQLVQSLLMKKDYIRHSFDLSSSLSNGLYVVSGMLSTGECLIYQRLIVEGR